MHDKQNCFDHIPALIEILEIFERWSANENHLILVQVGSKRTPINLTEISEEQSSNQDDENNQPPYKKIKTTETPEVSDIEIIKELTKQELKCTLCHERYTKTSAAQKNIKSCMGFHLYCSECLEEHRTIQTNGKKDTVYHCPAPGCSSIAIDACCYTNDSGDPNYRKLNKLLRTVNSNKCVIELLLVKGKNARNEPMQIDLPDSDNESELSEEEASFCLFCISEIETEVSKSACDCKTCYHKTCLDALRDSQAQCEQCNKNL